MNKKVKKSSFLSNEYELLIYIYLLKLTPCCIIPVLYTCMPVIEPKKNIKDKKSPQIVGLKVADVSDKFFKTANIMRIH